LPRIAIASSPDTFIDTAPRQWHPSATIRISVGVHSACAAALAFLPETWPWALGLVGANHAVLAGVVLRPRSGTLGPNLTRLSAAATSRREIALTFDDGPDPNITPRVLDLLDANHAKATFFVVGERARRHPALVREIVRRGHAVENHSYLHSVHFPWYGPRRLARDISAAQAAIADACGQAPIFFRAPMGFRTPLLDPVLARLGLHLVSWTRRAFDTVERDPRIVAARLSRDLGAGDILLMHDAMAILGRGCSTIVDSLDRLLATVADQQLIPVTLRSACGQTVAT
jgi:peptidoglycan-N-acetylglucosamine deacetylase